MPNCHLKENNSGSVSPSLGDYRYASHIEAPRNKCLIFLDPDCPRDKRDSTTAISDLVQASALQTRYLSHRSSVSCKHHGNHLITIRYLSLRFSTIEYCFFWPRIGHLGKSGLNVL